MHSFVMSWSPYDEYLCHVFRFASGYCQFENYLFVFGGLHSPTKQEKSTKDTLNERYCKKGVQFQQLLGMSSESNALNDLNIYDFLTEKWQRVRVEGNAPPPRGSSCISVIFNAIDTVTITITIILITTIFNVVILTVFKYLFVHTIAITY